jgi:L-threonylcarbamoyladenylate synthase
MNNVPHKNDDAEPRLETACLPATPDGIAKAAEFLIAGLPVAVPTETVYGLAANALDPLAVARIYAAKGRPSDNPLIVHVGDGVDGISGLVQQGLVEPLPAGSPQRVVAARLMQAFWPGPLTVVLPRGPMVPDAVTAGLRTAAFRMPAHPAFLALLAQVPFPLAAPSANRSNRISPTAASHVLHELGGRIPLVLDGGDSTVGLESTIVAVQPDGGVTLLRPGGVPSEAIAAVAEAPVRGHRRDDGISLAPGMRPVHYAPSRPLALLRRDDASRLSAYLATLPSRPRVAVLLLRGEPVCPDAWARVLAHAELTVHSLSDLGDGSLAAQQLFAALRAIDGSGVDLMVVEAPSPEDGGLWPAVHDRLTRAAAACQTIGASGT